MSALTKRKGSRGETGSGRSRQGKKTMRNRLFFVFIKKLAEIFSYRPERSNAGGDILVLRRKVPVQALGQSLFQHIVSSDDVFFFGDSAVQFSKGHGGIRCILAHQRKQNIPRTKDRADPINNAKGIFQISREDQMPDQYTALQKAVLYLIGTGLAEHLGNGFCCCLKIIRARRHIFARAQSWKILNPGR